MAEGRIPLFLSVEGERQWAGLPLHAHGTAGSGLYAALELYAECGVSGNVGAGWASLFLSAEASGLAAAGLTLVADGGPHSAWAALPLVLACTGSEARLDLFVRGSGVTDGAVPAEGFLALSVGRNTPASLSLYLGGPGWPVASSLPLSCEGAVGAWASVALWASGVGAAGAGAKLFTRGW